MNTKTYTKLAKGGIAIMAVLLMLTASFLPVAFADNNDEETISELGRDSDDLAWDLIRWGVSIFSVDPNKKSLLEIINNYRNQPAPTLPGAGDDEAIKQYARTVDAQRSAEQLYNLLMVASNLVDNDRETWKLTNSYLNRAGEISAGMFWDEGHVYDPDNILRYGGVYDAVATGNLNTSDILDRGISVSANLRDKWDATNYGQSLDIKLIWDGGSTGNASNDLYADFCTLATATDDEYVVYLANSPDEFITPTNSTIWAYTNSGSITPINGGVTTPLAKGANDVSDLMSGFYKLSPGQYGGAFLNSTSAEACKTSGIMGIVCDDRYGYALSVDNGVHVFWNGSTTASDTLDFEITGSDTVQTSNSSPFALVRAYGDYYRQLSELLYEASLAGQVMWTLSANAHASNILLSPSSIIPHLSNVGISAEQSYAMYVLALDQLAQYNANYGDELKAGMMKVSAQSLDLYCHGTVYSPDGTVIVENAIYSPYVYLKDWTIKAGEPVTFNQDGFIMVWDVADSAHDWTIPTDTTGYESIIVEKGAYILADEIYHGGESVTSVHLEVKEIQRLAVFDEIDFGREDTPGVLSATNLLMIVFIELGIIIGLLGYAIRMPSLYVVSLLVLILSRFIATLTLGLI